MTLRRRRPPLVAGIVLVAAILVAAPFAVPYPASAQPVCGPSGEDGPTQRPWPLRRLNPELAWPLTRGAGITVAVIDSGVSPRHPTLRGKVAPGRDFGLPDASGRCDQFGHGTVIAGLIAGRDGTGVPFTGVAPDATVLPGRVLQDDRESRDPGLPDRIATAIEWAVDNGADIVNLSLFTIDTPRLRRAVEYARAEQVVLVAAAGNVEDDDQVGRPAFPAAYETVIAVGGVGPDGASVGSSVAADYVDVAAPGIGVDGPAPRGDGYIFGLEGTSFATGYVSGVAALVRAYHPGLTASEVVDQVVRTADRPPEGRNDQLGHGVVNPYRAVATVLGSRSNPPPAPVAPVPVPPDPLAGERVIAGWAALAGAVLALVVLLGRPAIRRGRRRGWRAARLPDYPGA